MGFPRKNNNANAVHQNSTGSCLNFRFKEVSVNEKELLGYLALVVSFADACSFIASIFPSHSAELSVPSLSGVKLHNIKYVRRIKSNLTKCGFLWVSAQGERQPAFIEVQHLRHFLSLDLTTTSVELFHIASFFAYLEDIYRPVLEDMDIEMDVH